jgi:hypothetical protein
MAASLDVTACIGPILNGIERIMRCLDGMDTDGLNWRPPAPETNSLYVLAYHTMCSAEWAICGVLAGQQVERDRDAEFRASGDSAAPLYARWEELKPRLRTTLETLPQEALEKTVQHRTLGTMRGRDFLLVAVQHPAEHAGHAELTRDLYRASRAS